MMNVEELQHLPVERHDQPPQEGSAERLPLLPGRGQRWIQQEKRQLVKMLTLLHLLEVNKESHLAFMT